MYDEIIQDFSSFTYQIRRREQEAAEDVRGGEGFSMQIIRRYISGRRRVLSSSKT